VQQHHDGPLALFEVVHAKPFNRGEAAAKREYFFKVELFHVDHTSGISATRDYH
jgi:hypothetical protein